MKTTNRSWCERELVKKYLKSQRGHEVLLQCWGFAVRGKLTDVRSDGVVLTGASLFNETSRQPGWQPADGDLAIPAGQIRYAQGH
jgi:hypothetical protein